MTRFAHIADTHIRNLRYHDEYRYIFEKMYKDIKERNVDYIVHCGDIAHTKTKISPEYVSLATEFLNNLADIAPLIVILGNHDGQINNKSREDSVSPIIRSMKDKNVIFLKDSCEYRLTDDITLNVMSIFGEAEKSWVEPSDESKINIALFHGSVNGCEVDSGFTITNGDIDLEYLEKFDFAFLGDIHKTAQRMDSAGRYMYPGSTVQQNFGETNDKGYLVWDISSKDDWTCEHIPFPNPSPFITVKLDSHGNIVGDDIPENAKIRVFSYVPLNSHARMAKKREIKSKYKAKQVKYVSKSVGKYNFDKDVTEDVKISDVRDPGVQADLIRNYLETLNIEKSVIDEVVELNKEYIITESSDDVARNLHWKIKKLEWDNILSYGKGNVIDFDNVKGITGILGENYTGKSSSMEILMYSIFGNMSKNIRKTFDMINWNEEEAYIKVSIEAEGKNYVIERKFTKLNEEKRTARESIDFYIEGKDAISLNQDSKKSTEAYIRSIFGTHEDFLLTSYMSQKVPDTFIDGGSTNRKKIVARFLDLGLFEEKYNLVNEDSRDIRALLRTEYKDSKKHIAVDIRKEIQALRERLKNTLKEKEALSSEVERLYGNVQLLKREYDSENGKHFDNLDTLYEDRDEYTEKVKEIEAKQKSLKEQIDIFTEREMSFKKVLKMFDKENMQKDLKELEKKKLEREGAKAKRDRFARDLDRSNKEIAIINKVPCGGKGQYSSCKFLKKANDAKDSISDIESKLESAEKDLSSIEAEINKYDGKSLRETLEKIAKLEGTLRDVSGKLSEMLKEYEYLEKDREEKQDKLDDLEFKIKDLEKDKEVIEKMKKMEDSIEKAKKRWSEKKSELAKKDKEYLSLNSEILSKEEETVRIMKYEEKRDKYNRKYQVMDLYKNCMHSNGISLSIVNKMIPMINKEVNKITEELSDDLNIILGLDDRKLDVLMEKDTGMGPIESGSGAENGISSISLRLALMRVSSLPKANFFIMDEPATNFDEKHLSAFNNLFNILGEEFETVFVISHIEDTKDSVKNIINIEREGGYCKLRI